MPEGDAPMSSFVESVFSDAGPAVAAAPAPAPEAPPPVEPAAPPVVAPAPLDAPPAPSSPAGPETQQATPDAPVPAQFQSAVDFQTQIAEASAPLGGPEIVPEALKWTGMLFGLADVPEGATPAQHFMESLYATDQTTYWGIVNDAIATHQDHLMQRLEPLVLQKYGIAPEQLPEVQDYLRYGAAATVETWEREFVNQLPPELQSTFTSQSQAFRNWMIKHVNDDMPLEVAITQLQQAKAFAEMTKADDDRKARESESQAQTEQRETATIVQQTVQRYEDSFISRKAAEMQVDAETVRDWVVRTASELDRVASADPQHEAAIAWRTLEDAAKSRNQLKINAAMNRMSIAFEKAFSDLLQRRGKAPAAPAAPAVPKVPSSQNPQFDPDLPPSAQRQGASFVDLVFGNASPADYR